MQVSTYLVKQCCLQKMWIFKSKPKKPESFFSLFFSFEKNSRRIYAKIKVWMKRQKLHFYFKKSNFSLISCDLFNQFFPQSIIFHSPALYFMLQFNFPINCIFLWTQKWLFFLLLPRLNFDNFSQFNL